MKDFIFCNPTKIIFGKKAMGQIRSNIAPFGQKVLLTFGKGSIQRNGIYRKPLNTKQIEQILTDCLN